MTLPMQHYRSAKTTVSVSSLAVTVPLGNWLVGTFSPLSSDLPFWTAGGGIQSVNFGTGGVPVTPNLQPNTVVLRGGFTRIAVRNISANSDSFRVRLQKCYFKQQTRNYTDANSVAPASEWLADTVLNFNTLAAVVLGQANSITLQDRADYDEYLHRPLDDKEMLLGPGEEFEIKEKLRVKKIDADSFTRGGKYFPIYFVYLGNETTTGGAANAVNVSVSHNLSFSVVDI